MGTDTLDEVRRRIQRNFPNQAQSAAQRQKLLTWDRRTANTIVSSCGRFLISKAQDGAGGVDYSAFTAPGGPTNPGRKIAGPFLTAKECREAVQDYVNGEPMQQDLA